MKSTYSVTLQKVAGSETRTVHATANSADEAEQICKVPGWLTVYSERMPDNSRIARYHSDALGMVTVPEN